MTFELMLAGWPLLHNSVAWRDFGYWWTHEDMGAAVETLRTAMRKHAGRLETYAVEAEQLAWAHSVANPAVRAAWLGLLEPGDQIIMGPSPSSASATGTKAAAAALSKS